MTRWLMFSLEDSRLDRLQGNLASRLQGYDAEDIVHLSHAESSPIYAIPSPRHYSVFCIVKERD